MRCAHAFASSNIYTASEGKDHPQVVYRRARCTAIATATTARAWSSAMYRSPTSFVFFCAASICWRGPVPVVHQVAEGQQLVERGRCLHQPLGPVRRLHHRHAARLQELGRARKPSSGRSAAATA